MNTDAIIDALKASIEKIIPGGAAVLLGAILTLGLGLTWVLEGPPLVRAATAGMVQPFRSLSLFCGLALPLIILGYAFRKGLGYVISLITQPKRDRR